MPFRSEKQRRYLWKNNPEIARKWTNEHGSTPVKAKKGKYQKLEHPDHEIKPIEHKEENVSSKERVEKLLDERKTKKETKKKLVKQGTGYVPGWRPNLSVKATEGGPIKARKGIDIQKKSALNRIKYSSKWDKSLKNRSEIWKRAKETARDRLTLWDIRNAQKTIQGEKKQLESVVDVRSKGGPIKAKKGIGLPPATKYKKYLKGLKKATTTPLSGTSTALPPKTARLLSQLKFAYKDRNTSKFLKRRFSLAGQAFNSEKFEGNTSKFLKRRFSLAGKSFLSKQALNQMKKNIAKSPFLQRRFKLAGAEAFKAATSMAKPSTSTKALAVLKKLGKRTGIGKAVAAATAVAGAYEAGKRKLFTKDKKKVTKKSIGGETVVMKSGGGYINDLL